MPMSDQIVLGAKYLSEDVRRVWSSEETLLTELQAILPTTGALAHGGVTLVNHLLSHTWARALEDLSLPPYSLMDHEVQDLMVQLAKELDPNLWSQVYLNSRAWLKPTYKVSDLEQDLNKLQEQYANKEESPFLKKAKMLPEDGNGCEWNRSLALQKAHSILTQCPARAVYKLYPLGMTPAFSDSGNLSMLNQKYTDPYIMGFRTNEITFYEALPEVELTVVPEGILASGFEGVFVSKSGDLEGLRRVLGIRRYMHTVYQDRKGYCLLIPRWGSCSVFLL